MLATLGDWAGASWPETLDERWHARLAQVAQFAAEHGYLPHYHLHQSDDEHTLGVWLHVQHQARLEGRLIPQRLAELEAAMPGWRSRQ